MSRDRPSHIKFEDETFPVHVRQENIPTHSYISIEENRFPHEGSTLFFLSNAELSLSASDDHAQIKLAHQFAADDEGDTAYLAYMDLRSVQIKHVWNGDVTFSAWLTEVRYYPEGYAHPGIEGSFNPFKGVEKSEDDQENYNFPYTPSQVDFGTSLKLPRPVTVTINYAVDAEPLDKWIDSSMKRHAADRAKEAEEARVAKEESDRRHAEHLAWLASPEGIEAEAQSKARRAARALAQSQKTE